MNRQLAAAISSILAISAYSSVAGAQQDATPDPAAAPAQLEPVIVTGSWIPQIQQENASPVVAITAEDIDRQGFQNVAELLRAQPLATGAVQDNQFSGGFTPGATTISLLGLDPGFTLILLDGRPLADYPLLYNGAEQFHGPVEHPDRHGRAHRHAARQPVGHLRLRGDRGRGQHHPQEAHRRRASRGARRRLREGRRRQLAIRAVRRHGPGQLDVTYGLQYSSQKPIWGTDREWFDSRTTIRTRHSHFGSRTFLTGHVDIFTTGSGRPFTTIRARPSARPRRQLRRHDDPRLPSRPRLLLRQPLGDRLHQLPQRGGRHQRLRQRQLGGLARTPSSTQACWFPTTERSPTAARASGRRTSTARAATSGTTRLRRAACSLYQHIFSPEETGGRTGTRDQ